MLKTDRMIAKIGRNDPCPCGSGKKFKKCCAQSGNDTGNKSDYERMRDASASVVSALVDYADAIFPKDAMYDAAEEFGLGIITNDEVQEGIFNQLFVPWYVFLYEPEGNLNMTIAEKFLKERGSTLDELSSDYIEAARKTPLCYWQVIDVLPGRGSTVCNMVTQERTFIPDVSASNALQKWDILLGQVVSVGDLTNFMAISPYPLPPDGYRLSVDVLLESINAKARPYEELREYDYEFIDHYVMCMHDALNPTMPKLVNKDGDKFMFVKSVYSFKPADKASIASRLNGMRNIFQESDKCDSIFIWVVKDTLKAHISLKDGLMEIECNSRRRDKTIRKRIEKDVASLVLYKETEEREVRPGEAGAGMPELDEDSGRMDFDSLSPEDRQGITDMMEQQHMKWADESVPMLGNKTPRATVKTAAGKRRVAAMINDFEHRHSRDPDPQFRFDFNKLRADLGIKLE